MTKRPLVIDDINLEDVKHLLYTGQKMAITTATFEKIIELLEEKTAECEELKKKSLRLTAAGIDLNESRKIFREKFFGADKSRDSWREQAERYKQVLEQIRDYELENLDIEWDEYEVHCREVDYSPILTVVGKALGEIN